MAENMSEEVKAIYDSYGRFLREIEGNVSRLQDARFDAEIRLNAYDIMASDIQEKIDKIEEEQGKK